MSQCRIIEGDCVEVMAGMESATYDAVICDPPYPCIKRSYGTWTEAEWWEMMRAVVPRCMRVLKPSGSAVFILQPNSERVGRMRTWLWDFMAWAGREWGIVQDAYWWNDCAVPGGGEGNRRDLLRPSVKACVWVGPADCYRDRKAVMIDAAEATKRFYRSSSRYLRVTPGCHGISSNAVCAASAKTGEATPFNLLPFGNEKHAGEAGHGAGTPMALARWWVRYLVPPGGIVLDPFAGSGTVPLAALKEGRRAVGIERVPEYAAIARKRIADAAPPLFTA